MSLLGKIGLSAESQALEGTPTRSTRGCGKHMPRGCDRSVSKRPAKSGHGVRSRPTSSSVKVAVCSSRRRPMRSSLAIEASCGLPIRPSR